jgi:hypothetical protein
MIELFMHLQRAYWSYAAQISPAHLCGILKTQKARASEDKFCGSPSILRF